MRLSLPKPRFRPDIEGLRAVAILLVVGYHAGVPGFSGGYIGVDVFFVLSGYLITWLLVHEIETTGRLDFARFYARRARRLLPAIAVVLVAVVGVSAVLYAPLEQRTVAKTAVATAAYLANVYFARNATNYLAADIETNPLLHAWSLSVEEQFYLVWPLLVLLALRTRAGSRGDPDGVPGGVPFGTNPRRLLAWMVGLAVLSFGVSAVVTAYKQPIAFFHSPLRAWEFAAGALALLLPRPRREQAWAGWLGLGAVLGVAAVYDGDTLFPGGAAFVPMLGTALILRRRGEGVLGRVLAWRPFQEAGRLSYSWYLWHWPVLVFGASLVPSLSLAGRLALVAVSLGLAEASYRWIENPVRYSPALARHPRNSLAMGAALTVATVAVGALALALAGRWAQQPGQRLYTTMRDIIPVLSSNGCHANYEETTARFLDCAVGSGTARTIVLFGDSHAAQWYPVLADLAEAEGWRLVPATKSSCPAVDAPMPLTRYSRPYEECEAWRDDVFEKIAALRPDLVIAVSSRDYPLEPAVWGPGMQRTADALAPASERVVLLRDPPDPDIDVLMCEARTAWRLRGLPVPACVAHDADPSRGAAYAAERAAAERHSNVESVDLNALICPEQACTGEREGVFVYRDDQHLTPAFVRTLDAEMREVIAPSEATARGR